ncbi:MAG: hypothetical protein LBU57_05615 [Dysgonamonadaceae bacterium]|jgi:hypothetical protein|nr:hypothetical protein [Dysgonamonadaceae bacterium]
MKHLIIFFIGLTAFFVSCIEDNGNYDYTEPETPVVKIDSVYSVFVGDQLVIEPEVKFYNKDLLSFEWTIIDPDQMTDHRYEGAKLDIFFALGAKLYSARLAVTDKSNGMKYFFPFSIYGNTAFNEGTVLLTSNNGHGQLSFIKPDGVVQENIYGNMYHEDLPKLLQIVPLQHQNMTGKPYLGYWIISSDKENPGVQIDASNMTRIKFFRENFFSIPKGEIAAGPFIPRDDATMCGVVNGKFYTGAFETYYLSPAYGYFGTPIQGDYEVAPVLAASPDKTFVWGYNPVKKSLICFIPPGRLFFDATAMPGPPPVFDPANRGLELITLLPSNSAFYLFGKDNAGKIQELKFSTGGQMVITQYKREFSRPDLIRDDTKWILLPGLEVFYFTSGNKVYKYNPLNESIEPISAQFASNVSMLKTVSSEMIAVGENGRLHWLDISVGHNGEIVQTIDGFEGEPVDIYIRKDLQ